MRVSKKPGALMSYHSLRVKGSTTFFLMPFLPFDKRLFCKVSRVLGILTGRQGVSKASTGHGQGSGEVFDVVWRNDVEYCRSVRREYRLPQISLDSPPSL